MRSDKQCYKVAWKMLLRCIEKGYDLGSWIAPIPEEHKKQMIAKAKEYLQKEQALKKEPCLFNDE